jgi:meiotically up-regulated gene 157 (Mug157) protein
VITGDIEAMWLRDSTNQLIPYVPYASQDTKLAALLEGLIARQARSVIIDPFANAFNYNASGEGHQSDTRYPPMGPAVFEGKYEIDSISAFLKVSYWYWRYTDMTTFMTSEWFEAVCSIVDIKES